MQIKPLAIALAAAGLLSACAGAYAGGSFADFGPDAWYDGFYGPYAGGYWGSEGRFYYGDGHHGFRPDMAGHFQHHGGGGFAHVHGSGGPNMARR